MSINCYQWNNVPSSPNRGFEFPKIVLDPVLFLIDTNYISSAAKKEPSLPCCRWHHIMSYNRSTLLTAIQQLHQCLLNWNWVEPGRMNGTCVSILANITVTLPPWNNRQINRLIYFNDQPLEEVQSLEYIGLTALTRADRIAKLASKASHRLSILHPSEPFLENKTERLTAFKSFVSTST